MFCSGCTSYRITSEPAGAIIKFKSPNMVSWDTFASTTPAKVTKGLNWPHGFEYVTVKWSDGSLDDWRLLDKDMHFIKDSNAKKKVPAPKTEINTNSSVEKQKTPVPKTKITTKNAIKNNTDGSAPTPSQPAKQVVTSQKNTFARKASPSPPSSTSLKLQAMKAVRSRLRDYSNASFITSSIQTTKVDDKYYVIGKFKSKNAFGAKITSTFAVEFVYTGSGYAATYVEIK